MARIARVVVPGYPRHITQRGNRGMETFFRDEDYETNINLVSKACREVGTEVWEYCLMPNYVHLVVVPGDNEGLRSVLGDAHRPYTREINFRYRWRGHLWQERFHSFPMDESYFLATVRYVKRNPVKAKLCRQPEDWPWSSARAHLEGSDDALVRVGPMLGRVNDWQAYLTEESSSEQIIKRHSRTGRPLGNAQFIENLEKLLGRDFTPKSLDVSQQKNK